MQQALGLILIVTAGYFLYQRSQGAGGGAGGGAGAGAVQFLDSAGNPITQATCGDTIGFDVAGYSEVWLIQTKDDMPQFNGPFRVPMQPYALSCSSDVGVYKAAVYQRAQSGPDPGPLIGSAQLVVMANYPGGGGGNSGQPELT